MVAYGVLAAAHHLSRQIAMRRGGGERDDSHPHAAFGNGTCCCGARLDVDTGPIGARTASRWGQAESDLTNRVHARRFGSRLPSDADVFGRASVSPTRFRLQALAVQARQVTMRFLSRVDALDGSCDGGRSRVQTFICRESREGRRM